MKNWPVLGLYPLSGILLLTQLTAVKKGEWGGVGCEWPKYWQSCWQEGDAGLLTCLGQTLIKGEAGGDWFGLEKSCCIRDANSIFDSSAVSIRQHWSTQTKRLSRHGWFEHCIPHPPCFLESECVEPNVAAWHFSLFGFSWKTSVFSVLTAEGWEWWVQIAPPVIYSLSSKVILCKWPFVCLSDQ